MLNDRLTLSDSFEPATIFLRYSILVPTPNLWRESLKKKGYILGDWYNQVIGPKSVDLSKTEYIPKSCLNAEYASRHVLNLPTHHKISEKQANKLCKYLIKLANKIPTI